MSNFGPKVLARFAAVRDNPNSASPTDAEPPSAIATSFDLALKLLADLQELNLELGLRENWIFKRLPRLDSCPESSRFRLLSDCESRDPRQWLEIGSDGNLFAERERPNPVDFGSTDLILAPESPTSVTSSASTPLDHVIRLSREWLAESREEFATAVQARKRDEAEELANQHKELENAVTLLAAFQRANVSSVERIVQIRSFACGYDEMHLAVDMGSDDRSRWVEVKNDGTLCPLGKAKPENYRISSGYLVVRPRR